MRFMNQNTAISQLAERFFFFPQPSFWLCAPSTGWQPRSHREQIPAYLCGLGHGEQVTSAALLQHPVCFIKPQVI